MRQLHECSEIPVADVLAQAHRDDAIEPEGFAGGLAIVPLLEPHRQSLAEIPTEGHLFARDVIADHLAAIFASRKMGQSAESAAQLQQRHAG